MKYVFLFFGLIIGLFWSQIYSSVGKWVGDDFFHQAPSFNLVAEQGSGKVAKKPVAQQVIEPRAPAKVSEPTESSKPQKQVIMYATAWCNYCKQAREYFKKTGVSYIEYDIEKDETAKRMHELLGGRGVPLILYNGKKMTGFSKASFLSLYQ